MNRPIQDAHLAATREELVEFATSDFGGRRLPLEFVDHQTDSVLRHFASLEAEQFAAWLEERRRPRFERVR